MREVINKYPRLLHGGDYNPEQWLDSPQVLEEDIRLMKETRVNCVSLGIFSWARLEPEEGEFHFGWIRRIIDKLYENGIYTILATPTGAMPNWMTAKYEEVRQMSPEGVRNLPGRRHNFCYTSPIMRKKMKKINHELSRHLGDHPGVILWHISNEYGGNGSDASCHCPQCQQAFREWLKEKYKTLDNLNHAWWTAFWSHTYTDWSQIHSPVPNGESRLHGLNLDWKRFVSHQIQDFCMEEIRAVLKYSVLPVTTNMMEYFKPLDYFRFAPQLSIISWDNYPEWHSQKDEVNVAVRTAAWHSMMRSLKKAPFLMMESTPSIVNWKAVNTQKRPGLHELSSLQAVACGSNSVQYFQWRKSRGSSEKFHGAVVDHRNGSNTRVFREVSALGSRMEQISDTVYPTCNRPKAAIVFDWENWWAVEDIEGPRKDMAYQDTILAHFKPFWEMGIDVDFVNEDCDLQGYRLVAAPLNYLYKKGYAKKVKDYVEAGGCYVATYFSGVVDETDLCILDRHPLEELLGIRTEEMDAAPEHRVNSIGFEGKSYKTGCLREISHVIPGEGAEVLASYESDYYAGCPALTRKSYGSGRAYYLACETEEAFLKALYAGLAEENGIGTEFTGRLPYGVTVSHREGGQDLWFVQNFNEAETQMELPGTYARVEDGMELKGSITLKPFECLILAAK